MNAAQLFVTALIVGFSGAMMPGPLLTLNIEESMRRGALTGPMLVFGHALLELTLIVAILFGFGRILGLGAVKGAIGLAGGVVLLWMACGMLREAKGSLSLDGQERTERRGMPPVMAGAVISFANPYWSVWWATVGLTYLTRARELAFYGVGLFFMGHILADLTWYSAVSFAVARGRKLFSDRVYRGIIFVCGLFLIYVGLWFIDSAFGFLGLRQPSSFIRLMF
ncbi:MAG: LysE family transporter [Bacteroidota bacterium]